MKRIPPMGNASTPKESDFPKIASPAQRALAGAGCARLKQLTRVSEAELLQLHGMEPKALRQLRKALAERGWSFRGQGKVKGLP